MPTRPKLWGEQGYPYGPGENLPTDPGNPTPGPTGYGSTYEPTKATADDKYGRCGRISLRYNILLKQLAAWQQYADGLEGEVAAAEAEKEEALALLAASQAALAACEAAKALCTCPGDTPPGDGS